MENANHKKSRKIRPSNCSLAAALLVVLLLGSCAHPQSGLMPTEAVRTDANLSGNKVIDGTMGALWALSVLGMQPVGSAFPRDMISGTCRLNISGQSGVEKPCQNVEVILLDRHRTELQRTWTDASGSFYLSKVQRGSFSLRFWSEELGLRNEVDSISAGQHISVRLSYD